MYTSMYTTLKELSEHPDTQGYLRNSYRSLESLWCVWWWGCGTDVGYLWRGVVWRFKNTKRTPNIIIPTNFRHIQHPNSPNAILGEFDDRITKMGAGNDGFSNGVYRTTRSLNKRWCCHLDYDRRKHTNACMIRQYEINKCCYWYLLVWFYRSWFNFLVKQWSNQTIQCL